MAHKDKHKDKPKKPKKPKEEVGVEFLVAARDLESGYKRGDPITVQADGHVWGAAETLPDFWIVKVPGLALARAEQAVGELWEPAQEGDPEYESPDFSDRRIKRHRSRVRLIYAHLSPRNRNQLESTGVVTLTAAQSRKVYRRLRYDRASGHVEETAEREF